MNADTKRALYGDRLISVAVILSGDISQIELFVRSTLFVLKKHYQYHELLLIDNSGPRAIHSYLQTLQQQVPNVRAIRLSRRYGMEVALSAALDHCIGDYVILMDSCEHGCEVIPRLVERSIEGSDLVVVRQFDSGEPRYERWMLGGAYRLASRVLGVPMDTPQPYCGLLSRRLVNSMVQVRNKNRYLSHLSSAIGFHQTVMWMDGVPPVRRRPGQLIRRLTDLTKMLVSNSAVPLRFAAALGMAASLGNALYLIYILGVTVLKSRIAEGWLTASITQTSMFLMLFVILTILSEYIAQILGESKEEPLYFVESETSSTVIDLNRDRLNVIFDGGKSAASGAAGV